MNAFLLRTSRQVLPTGYVSLFNGTENPISESNSWLSGKTYAINNQDVQTTSGISCATAINNPAGPFDDSIAILNPSNFAIANNQSITGTVFRAGGYTPTNNHEINLFLRGTMTPGVGISGYEINLSLKGDYGFIMLWKGLTNTLISSFQQLTSISHPALNDGDTVYAEVVGNVITVKVNGSTQGSYDTSGDIGLYGYKWNSGTPGVDYWAESGSTLTSAGLTSITIASL